MWIHKARYWAELIYLGWMGTAVFAGLAIMIWEGLRRK